jgi:hypothetical protein
LPICPPLPRPLHSGSVPCFQKWKHGWHDCSLFSNTWSSTLWHGLLFSFCCFSFLHGFTHLPFSYYFLISEIYNNFMCQGKFQQNSILTKNVGWIGNFAKLFK